MNLPHTHYIFHTKFKTNGQLKPARVTLLSFKHRAVVIAGNAFIGLIPIGLRINEGVSCSCDILIAKAVTRGVF